MNYFFSTGAERTAVIEDLRKKDVIFPSDWDAHRTRQRQSKTSRKVFSAFAEVTDTSQLYPGCSDITKTNVQPPLSCRRVAYSPRDWRMSILKVL